MNLAMFFGGAREYGASDRIDAAALRRAAVWALALGGAATLGVVLLPDPARDANQTPKETK